MLREILSHALTLYIAAIIVIIVASWLPQMRNNDALRTFINGCEALAGPYLALWRKIIPPVSVGGMGLDLSPLVGVLVLSLGGRVLIGMIPA